MSRDGVGPSLVEADLVGCGRREYPLRRLVDGVSFYPLDLAVSVGDVRRRPRLELCRQGLDEDIVVLKAMSG